MVISHLVLFPLQLLMETLSSQGDEKVGSLGLACYVSPGENPCQLNIVMTESGLGGNISACCLQNMNRSTGCIQVCREGDILTVLISGMLQTVTGDLITQILLLKQKYYSRQSTFQSLIHSVNFDFIDNLEIYLD